MINEQELELKAGRYKLIQKAVKAVGKKRAERLTERRREAEFKRDLKSKGVE